MAFCVPTPNVSVMDLTCCLEKAVKYDIKKVVKQASRASWATLKTRVSPATSTVTSTLPLSMPGLALLSVTTVSSSFPAYRAKRSGWDKEQNRHRPVF
ncbi:hypothetical protein GH733_014794 [Mirounga leonina]|nr:hypothetical protein GH733_014794 [Mirounga leonina]